MVLYSYIAIVIARNTIIGVRPPRARSPVSPAELTTEPVKTKVNMQQVEFL